MPDGSWPISAFDEQTSVSREGQRKTHANASPTGPRDDGFARQAAEMAYERAWRAVAPELRQLRVELEKRDALLRTIAEAESHWAPKIASVARLQTAWAS